MPTSKDRPRVKFKEKLSVIQENRIKKVELRKEFPLVRLFMLKRIVTSYDSGKVFFYCFLNPTKNKNSGRLFRYFHLKLPMCPICVRKYTVHLVIGFILPVIRDIRARHINRIFLQDFLQFSMV